MTIYQLADICSNTINPVFGVLLLEEPLLEQGVAKEHWALFWVRSLIATAIAVALAEAGKHFVVWAGHPSFPSGHTTFATSVATSIVLRRGPKWAVLVAPLVLLMGWSLVCGGWHRPADIPGGILLGIFVPGLVMRSWQFKPHS